MDTLLLLKDTITAQVVKVVNSCQPCVLGAATNENNVRVADIICNAVVNVILYLVIAFLIWKLLEAIAKGVSRYYTREWDVQDRRTKQKADLLEKELIAISENKSQKYIDAIDETIKKLSNPE